MVIYFTYDQTDDVITSLPNGKKMVMTTITVKDAETIGIVWVRPLNHVEYFFVGYPKTNAVPTSFMRFRTYPSDGESAILITATDSIDKTVFSILSFGY